MKRILILATLAVSTLVGCSKEQIQGSGNLQTEFRNVPSFNRVTSDGIFEVTISKSDEQSVAIRADDNIVNKVRTEVQNGSLHIYLEDGNYGNVHVEATITIPELIEVRNSGAGDMYVFGNTETTSFKAMNTGAANVYLAGTCTNIGLHNEGSGNVFAYDMPANNGFVYNEGSGTIEISCEDNLDVTIIGSGDVHYKGLPLVDISISGSGQLIPEN